MTQQEKRTKIKHQRKIDVTLYTTDSGLELRREIWNPTKQIQIQIRSKTYGVLR